MVWIIGCKGMLGSQLCCTLGEKNIDYTGTDNSVSILDYKKLESFASGKDISFIVNCAAYTAVDKAESEADSARALNAKGPENIARLSKKLGCPLIHISTDYVFDGKGNRDERGNIRPYTEEDTVNPQSIYGKTKAEGEKAVMSETEDYYILRTAWLYGFYGKNFVYTILKAMKNNPSVKVVNDQYSTPTFCTTLTNIILKIIKKSQEDNAIPYGIYHVTDEGQSSWYDFALEIQRQYSLRFPDSEVKNCRIKSCKTSEYSVKARRPAYSVLSKEKIQKVLSVKLPEWKESLKAFLSQLTENEI